MTNEVRLPGQYHDRNTKLYYNWHRYYNPSLGRYYQADPVELGAVNRYQYVENNPLRYSDPTGEVTLEQIYCTINYFLKWQTQLHSEESRYYGKDKEVHCVAACEISKSCFGKSSTETFGLGIGKEFLDLFRKIIIKIQGSDPSAGTGFSFADILANKAGITCAKSKCGCETCCFIAYLRPRR